MRVFASTSQVQRLIILEEVQRKTDQNYDKI